MELTSASRAAFLVQLTTVIVPVLEALLGRRKLKPQVRRVAPPLATSPTLPGGAWLPGWLSPSRLTIQKTITTAMVVSRGRVLKLSISRREYDLLLPEIFLSRVFACCVTCGPRWTRPVSPGDGVLLRFNACTATGVVCLCAGHGGSCVGQHWRHCPSGGGCDEVRCR